MKKIKTPKEKWVWMAHPAHFICARDCRFFLATKVGNYIVSTVGEYLPDAPIREIYSKTRNIPIEGMGDARLADYMKKIGFEDLHFGGFKYETMVFTAKPMPKGECPACPWRIEVTQCHDEKWYKNSKDAYKGHMALCDKFARK